MRRLTTFDSQRLFFFDKFLCICGFFFVLQSTGYVCVYHEEIRYRQIEQFAIVQFHGVAAWKRSDDTDSTIPHSTIFGFWNVLAWRRFFFFLKTLWFLRFVEVAIFLSLKVPQLATLLPPPVYPGSFRAETQHSLQRKKNIQILDTEGIYRNRKSIVGNYISDFSKMIWVQKTFPFWNTTSKL